MRKIVFLYLIFNTLISYSQENERYIENPKDSIVSSFNVEFGRASRTKDFLLMNQLLSQPEIKEHFGVDILVAYYVQFNTILLAENASKEVQNTIQESIMQQSLDSTFQTKYVAQLYRDNKYEILNSYLNQVEGKYYDHLAYLQIKALTLEHLSRYDEANAINNEVLKMDEMKQNGFAHYSIGSAQFRYGSKIYELGTDQKKANSYFNMAFVNMRKANDLSKNDQLKKLINCSINEQVSQLARMGMEIKNINKLTKHFDGIEHSSPINCNACFPQIYFLEDD